MKKVILAIMVTLVVAVIYSCAKEKDCVCSVEGKGDVIRLHTDNGECIDFRYLNDANGLEEVRLFCMEDTL
ncbi:MAG: hypothetical protein IKQ94_01065 [Bacteroidales bacterium]|nr:hypothetical protein [Bacteroidales bacterium]